MIITPPIIQRFYSSGDIILSLLKEINLGFSKANNQAVKSAKGEHLLNPDTVIPENLFDPFFKGENDLNNMGILGFRMIDAKGQFLKESKRNSPTKRMVIKKLLGIKNNYYSKIDEFDFDSVDILCGANMLISNKVFNQINCLTKNISCTEKTSNCQKSCCLDLKIITT